MVVRIKVVKITPQSNSFLQIKYSFPKCILETRLQSCYIIYIVVAILHHKVVQRKKNVLKSLLNCNSKHFYFSKNDTNGEGGFYFFISNNKNE